MKRCLIFIYFICIYLLCAIIPSQASEEIEKVEIFYFYSTHCKECYHVETNYLIPIEEQYDDKILLKRINIDEKPENIELAVSMVLGDRKTGTMSPSIVIGKDVLMGSPAIEKNLHHILEKHFLDHGDNTVERKDAAVLSIFKNISILTVISSGLIDGINPCAFAVIAFFIAIMSTYRFTKKNVIIVGLFYCLAVFIAYFLIGIGLLGFIYTMNFYSITSVFQILVGVMCLIFALFSIHDYLRYKATGTADGLFLVLPKTIKRKISTIIGGNFRARGKESPVMLSIVSFSTGMIVSILEMVCTGQVYLPALVYIMKVTHHKMTALALILIYNFMFILPLVGVLVFFLCGIRSEIFNHFLKKHTGILKMLLALIFLTLGIGILLAR
jgi:hypothetical protein